jgi:hypothetical protein
VHDPKSPEQSQKGVVLVGGLTSGSGLQAKVEVSAEGLGRGLASDHSLSNQPMPISDHGAEIESFAAG